MILIVDWSAEPDRPLFKLNCLAFRIDMPFLTQSFYTPIRKAFDFS